MIRRMILAALFLLFACSLVVSSPVQAAADSVALGAQLSNGCTSGAANFEIHFTIADTSQNYAVRTIASAGGNVYMDELLASEAGTYLAGKTDWGVFDENQGGTQTAHMPIPANTPITVTVYFEGTSSSVTYFCDSFHEGPYVPNGFVLRTITCTTAVFDVPGGQPVGDNMIQTGQTWYVNPVSVADAQGTAWTEIYVSGPMNAYIWTSCVGGIPAGYNGS